MDPVPIPWIERILQIDDVIVNAVKHNTTWYLLLQVQGTDISETATAGIARPQHAPVPLVHVQWAVSIDATRSGTLLLRNKHLDIPSLTGSCIRSSFHLPIPFYSWLGRYGVYIHTASRRSRDVDLQYCLLLTYITRQCTVLSTLGILI